MFKLKYLIFLFTSHSLYALTTLTVTVSTDNNPGGMGIGTAQSGDLRYCLNTMNQGLNTAPDDYAIVFASPMTIQLNGILPIINNSSNAVNITIGNTSPTSIVTIDGNSGAYPGLFIPIGNVTIQNIIFQNLTARGGDGGDGISGGGGGMGAGGAIYAPQLFFNDPAPAITLLNISINNCSAVGGNGGNYFNIASPTGDEGGGGGGGFSGNGGSITVIGNTGGAGGGGFGGDGGDVTLSPPNGGGGGGGGLGSRANNTFGTPTNLGTGGSDQEIGAAGNGYGLSSTAGSGAGGNSGGNTAGGGGGGNGASSGGGGGGSAGGTNGSLAEGSTPPGNSIIASGGNGGDGGGGGGGGVVTVGSNSIDGQAGTGGYAGGGGGGAGTGASDNLYTVQGGSGGVGGGGGGGGVNQSGTTPATGGNSNGGGGGGGGGPSNSSTSASGGMDAGSLGGGIGGDGASSAGFGFGGGGGGGGSGLGGAIFIDSGLNLTIQALSGIPTTFNTSSNMTMPGVHGLSGPGGEVGVDGSALGNCIFLRANSSLTLLAQNTNDLLTLSDQVAFVDDTSFNAGGTEVFVTGNGTIVYNGVTNYQGDITINNANFKVNGLIDNAPISVCRDIGLSSQRGTLSGSGMVTGDVLVNSGSISPDTGQTLTLGSLSLSSADPINNTLGSLVHIEINGNSTSLVSVNGPASLAGTLEIQLDSNAQTGSYIILSSSGITGTFDSVTFTNSFAGTTPDYTLSYLPVGNPMLVQFDLLSDPPSITQPTNLIGFQQQNDFGVMYELFNTLQWQPSTSAVQGYYIYRNNVLIATVNAATTTYQDHNQPRGIATLYGVAAFDGAGNISSQATVTVN